MFTVKFRIDDEWLEVRCDTEGTAERTAQALAERYGFAKFDVPDRHVTYLYSRPVADIFKHKKHLEG